MSKADLSTILASIQTRNAARVVAALVAIDRWGERVTFAQIAKAIEVLTDAEDMSPSVVDRGLKNAVETGLIVEAKRSGRAFGYLPGKRLAKALSL